MKKSDTHVSKNRAQESLALFLDTGGVDFFNYMPSPTSSMPTYSTASENMEKSDTHVSKNRAQESLARFLDTEDVDFFLNYMPTPESCSMIYT